MEPNTGKQLGWFGLLMIAVVSGLVVKVVGDPLVQVISPMVEDAAEEITDSLQDQPWGKQLNRWLEDWLSLTSAPQSANPKSDKLLVK